MEDMYGQTWRGCVCGNSTTHLSGFTNKVVSPHKGADGHLEKVAFAGVLGDAAEGMHDKQLLEGLELD